MTDEELREWRRREIRCRVEEDAVRAEPLAPPSAFSDAYAPEHPEVEGGRGPESSTVRGLLGGGCCVGELEEVIISEVPSTACGRPC